MCHAGNARRSRADEGYLEEQALPTALPTRVGEALAWLAVLEPAVSTYTHALTNFVRTEVEVGQHASGCGQGEA